MGALKSMREAAGITVRDMARDVSVSEETYMRWEQGDIQNISPIVFWRRVRRKTSGGSLR